MSEFSKSRAKPRRIIALWFPRLSTDRLQRHENTSAMSPPLVMVAKVKNAIALQAVDRKATQLGLRFGQPLANARAMLPDLRVVNADETADAQLLKRIADWCDRFTPLVALDGARHLLLDVTGVCHFFGGEQNMLAQICSKLESQGLAVRGAMAGTAAAARALARYRKGSIISSGQEAEAVKPLPVEALGLDHVIIHAFRRAGLKTVGQVAGRKRDEINARFGAATLDLLDEILGQGAKPISPRRPRAEYWKEKAFPEPIATDDLIQDTLKSLAQGIAALMQKNGVGARQLQATFFRADGAVRTISIALGTATREPVIIMRLFREKLDVLRDPLDPGFGFDLIRLSATEVAPFDVEIAELDSNLAAQKEIGFLVDRLATRFGASRVLAFQPNDTHIPENAFSTMPAQKAGNPKAIWEKLRATDPIPRRPLRLFAQVLPISMANSQLNWRRLPRTIAQQEGPERIAMEWWRHEEHQPDRDYFRMEDDQGRRYWLYRDSATAQWVLHGLFA